MPPEYPDDKALQQGGDIIACAKKNGYGHIQVNNCHDPRHCNHHITVIALHLTHHPLTSHPSPSPSYTSPITLITLHLTYHPRAYLHSQSATHHHALT